jgi:hypothetical protein
MDTKHTHTYNVHTGNGVVVLHEGYVDIISAVLRFVAILSRTAIWIFDVVRKQASNFKNIVTGKGNSSGE